MEHTELLSKESEIAQAAWSAIDAAELESLRDGVKTHIDLHSSLSGLNIETMAPPQGMPFQFIHSVPKLPDIAQQDKSLWYPCSYCERNYQFKDGRIVYCADKKLRLIGNDCWKKHIDKDTWNAAREDYSIYQRRKKFDLLKERYIPAVKKVKNALKSHQNQIALLSAFIDSFAASFRERFPDLSAALDKATKNNNALTVYGYVQSENGGYKPSSEVISRFRHEKAIVQGQNAIQPVWDLALAEIHKAEYMFEKTDWNNLSNRQFNSQVDGFQLRCREAIEKVKTVTAKINAVWSFMGTENIARIVTWANHPDCELHYTSEGKYEVASIGLRYILQNGQALEMILPQTLRPAQVDGIDELDALLNRT